VTYLGKKKTLTPQTVRLGEWAIAYFMQLLSAESVLMFVRLPRASRDAVHEAARSANFDDGISLAEAARVVLARGVATIEAGG
jgi:hypothetical protein